MSNSKLSGLTESEGYVLENVQQSLEEGLELYRWWRQAEHDQVYQHIPVVRQLNRPDSNYGFLSEAPLRSGLLPVLGVSQSMFYDRPKAHVDGVGASAEWYRSQIKTFALRYFLRTSSMPVTQSPNSDRKFPDQGWSFQQVFFKLRKDGKVGVFDPSERFRIIDLRKLFDKYEWVVFKVRLFDFTLSSRIPGLASAHLDVPMNPVVWVVAHRKLCVDRENPAPGILGEYGGGWAVIPFLHPESYLAYGPAQLLTTFEFIHFSVLANGEIWVRVVFVSNKPTRLLNFRPLEFGMQLLDLATLGSASHLLRPFREALAKSHLLPEVGVELTLADLANSLTGGVAARQFCISESTFYRYIMSAHFTALYNFVLHTIPTWSMIPDWNDTKHLPTWVREGVHDWSVNLQSPDDQTSASRRVRGW